MNKRLMYAAMALSLAFGGFGCDSDSGTDNGMPVVGDDDGPIQMGRDDGPLLEDDGPLPEDMGDVDFPIPDRYGFESRFDEGVDSVSYNGQTGRHLLISDMKSALAVLTAEIDNGDGDYDDGVDPGEVEEALDYFFSINGADRAEDPFRLSTDPATMQSVYQDISTGNLLGKTAGNDASTDFRDWSTEFVGWDDDSLFPDGQNGNSPTELVEAFIATVEAMAILRSEGTPARSPVAEPADLPVYVTPEGLDLRQLLEKFLLGAVAFSQGADDYTDDDVENKGLLSDNVERRNGEDSFTLLEHSWDEAFGYFGANRDYGELSIDDIANGPRAVDSNNDGMIDLRSEYNWGASVNAAKRDNGANVATNFTETAWDAFRAGRTIIQNADGNLTADELSDLQAQRDLAIGAWEDAIAATAIHYVNDTLQIMATIGTEDYDHEQFLDHATVWGEMKGFALSFQFNPRSPVSQADFAMIHTLMGDRPILEADGETALNDYRVALRSARTLIGTSFGFDTQNLGDDDGNNGW